MSAARPLFPRKRTSIRDLAMSHSCQEATYAVQKKALLFDHLVGTREHGRRNVEIERLRSLEVDDQLVLGRCLHRQVWGLLALENAIHVASRAPVRLDQISPIGDQAAADNEESSGINGWQSRRLRNVRYALPAQPVDATQALNLSAGVSNAMVLRG